MKNTIVALSSGAIKSAIAIIRMSGPDSFNILKNIFSNKQDYQANKTLLSGLDSFSIMVFLFLFY